jgi:rhamnopyranosyl-N-acetylglucosaminyl-diphospho-decaprenol beta-1,3/1,4-galactofuranosyltransferase
MRVLAHIHTMNDEAVIEQALEGLRRQSRLPDGVIIVDNASKDATLTRAFPKNVTVVRNSVNLGTSGAIRIGFNHALERGFDWTWVFDADSVPEPDALEKLLAFFERLPPSERGQVCFLASELINAEGEVRHRPMIFTNSTIKYISVEDDTASTLCDCYIWTGSLFRMTAVAKIGLPSADYVLDMAEFEYGYRARQLGFTSYMVHGAITHQDVGRPPGVVVTAAWNIGRFKLALREVSAIRTYYISRNLLYFWLYQFRPLRLRRVVYCVAHVLVFPVNFALRPVSHRRQLIAYMRGVWDGLTGHMERRY